MSRNYHLENLGERDGYHIWLVDGEKIRKELDENFVEYDSHYHLPFIPKDEFWIDDTTIPEERNYFIDHLLKEIEYLERGLSADEATRKADRFEKKERMHSKRVRRILNTLSHTELVEKIHKKKLGEYSSTVTVWLVDGKLVRDTCYVEYAEGGHDLVYSFIPHKEIWIEETLSSQEQESIVLHELHERYLMGHDGKDYVHAHHGATIVEDYYRDHPHERTARIKEEMTKNDSLLF